MDWGKKQSHRAAGGRAEVWDRAQRIEPCVMHALEPRETATQVPRPEQELGHRTPSSLVCTCSPSVYRAATCAERNHTASVRASPRGAERREGGTKITHERRLEEREKKVRNLWGQNAQRGNCPC